MKDDSVIRLRNVSKQYTGSAGKVQRLASVFMPGLRLSDKSVKVLDDVTFEVKRGEAVALIGKNGSGKSTLLQIIAGTLSPTAGEVEVSGRVCALLELGSGFNPEYTGRENAYLNGLLLGLKKEDIRARIGEIEDFADIGDAIERPVKTYSSGMLLRLAFAVQVLSEPDILIIDEALGVGDFLFQQKCLGYINKLRENGVSLLFVSHDMGMVRDICSRVLYLKRGVLAYDGPAKEGIYFFYRDESSPGVPTLKAVSSGNCKAPLDEWLKHSVWSSAGKENSHLMAVSFLDCQERPTETFRLGDKLVVRVCYRSLQDTDTEVSVVITDKFGAIVTATGTMHVPIDFPFSPESKFRVLDFEINLLLEAGKYGVSVNVGLKTDCNRGEVLNETGVLGPISVTWDYESEVAPFLGRIGLPVVIGKKFECDL